jgi:antitoxin (DNA-binding transcriptional repressor) of toxin-antitoxin stability system
MGLRRLLTRQPAEDALERLAELGRETVTHSTRPVAQLNGEAVAGRSCAVSVGEKPEPVAEISPAKRRRTVESSRSRSGYRWLSQRSRESQASWHDFVSTRF